VIEKLEEILYSPKQQNLGKYNPIDWHKRNSLLARLKLASLPEPWRQWCFAIGSIWLQLKGASVILCCIVLNNGPSYKIPTIKSQQFPLYQDLKHGLSDILSIFLLAFKPNNCRKSASLLNLCSNFKANKFQSTANQFLDHCCVGFWLNITSDSSIPVIAGS
jgi:hypothetical protein